MKDLYKKILKATKNGLSYATKIWYKAKSENTSDNSNIFYPIMTKC